MIYIARRKAVTGALFIIVAIVTLFIFPEKRVPVFSEKLTKCVIIDAGHGFPDGGAVGANGTVESTLNIRIALLCQKLLTEKGYSVIMTRTDENSISDDSGSVLKQKQSDMRSRLNIINTSKADIFVSIHMNKFTDSRYAGAQVIYSHNYSQSETLASLIQHRLCCLKDNKSKRVHLKAPGSIYLLKNASIPAVIVECGFLSNAEEEELLCTKKYQKAVAKAITAGIDDYYKEDGELQS